MVWWPWAKHINCTLKSFSSLKASFSLYLFFWPKSACNSLFIDDGVLPFYLLFEIRHSNAPGNIQYLFQDTSDIHSYNTRSSASNNFFTQSSRVSIQVNSFSRIRTKIWNKVPVSLRKLSKNAFKRKIKQTLFDWILASEVSYIDLPEIVQKVKLNLFSS